MTAGILLGCVAIRDEAEFTFGKACSMVEGAVKRKSRKFLWLNSCKCVKENFGLTEECGKEVKGARKFDLTDLTFFTIHNLGGKGKRKELAEGCKCAEGMSDDSDDSSEASETSPTVTKQDDNDDNKKICAARNAVPRTGYFHRDECKCAEDLTLSPECGDLWLKRKFDPKEVTNPDCRCLKEEEQVRSKEMRLLLGPMKAVETSPTESSEPSTETEAAKPSTEIKCKKDPPEPFKFGDIVQIEKKVHTGYWFEFAGVGIGAQYKDAGISGTVAQVVCSEETKGTEGRVCLRRGRKGARSAGCWDPENLVKLEE